ncbi:NCAIR mutase (PurE)-related protein [Methanolinea mesophila]|nr:NCAIR mutase (PurE)-related protein [Methanolinea mesophila]
MLREMLIRFRDGDITLEDAMKEIEGLRIETIGDFARIDLGRAMRCGMPEVVLAEGKEPGHLREIVSGIVAARGICIVSRLAGSEAGTLAHFAEEQGYQVRHNERARMMVISTGERIPPTGGVVAVITAGTSDIAVAEEARVIAEEMGCRVCTAYDVGAAGIHRLFPALRECLEAHAFVVAAGREGTLPAVVAGLVGRPVIGVPVSTGYGYMGKGRAALASMLQSCSVLTVVNIDAGFTAGASAALIANMVVESR